jgi:hypothetical protein
MHIYTIYIMYMHCIHISIHLLYTCIYTTYTLVSTHYIQCTYNRQDTTYTKKMIMMSEYLSCTGMHTKQLGFCVKNHVYIMHIHCIYYVSIHLLVAAIYTTYTLVSTLHVHLYLHYIYTCCYVDYIYYCIYTQYTMYLQIGRTLHIQKKMIMFSPKNVGALICLWGTSYFVKQLAYTLIS